MTPIEIMARAMVKEHGWEKIPNWSRGSYLRSAQDAITALEANGYAIVPVEPTEAMISAAIELRLDAGPSLIWEEMIATKD